MPQTYICTIGFGSNGTTSRAAVSNRRIVTRSDPGKPQPGSNLVPDVDRQQHRGERLHAHGVLQGTAVERAEIRDAADDLEERGAGSVVVTTGDDVALHLLVEVHQLGRRHEVERGHDLGA